LSNSAKPSETVIVPDLPISRFSAIHVASNENIRVGPLSSASSKYYVEIVVLE